MISVVIPTRNRNNLLKGSIEAILLNKIEFNSIIIIDSSDDSNFKSLEYLHHKISHVRTKIQSAARQRNIGIRNLNPNEKYLAFIDDDVIVPKDYFCSLIKTLINTDCIGVSGLALNPKTIEKNKNNTFQNFVSRFFLLSSKKEGVVLRSGVNIPVKQHHKDIFEVEWLIGCSVWNFSKIRDLRFREDFKGQSLGEDVIYSRNAKKLGKLYVDPSVILTHLESSVMRPNDEEFMNMWVKNRLEIVKENQIGFLDLLAFNWCNLGKFLQILIFKKNHKIESLMGMVKAYKEIRFKK
jgi:glycosyltransferase involved in cell wall biosynthesis